MILRRLLTIAILLTSTIWSQAQQINAVPDYVFRNQMSVGRNAVTDTAAYFSIGPRYGATKGFMPPIVGDTATFSSGKRNGLLIFSVQKNKFLYWDSVRVQWSDMAGSSGAYIVAGDTSAMLAPYLRKSDTTAMLTNYVRHAGYGLTKSGQSFLVDTLNIATRAWRQKGIDSVTSLITARPSGSGTTNYIPKWTASGTIGNSQIFDNGTSVGIGTNTPEYILHLKGSILDTWLTIENTTYSSVFRVGSINGEGRMVINGNNPLAFYSNGIEQMRIGGNGFVGMGTNSPTDRLHVSGRARVTTIDSTSSPINVLTSTVDGVIRKTSLAAIASAGVDTTIISTRAWRQKGLDSLAALEVSGSGTTNYVPKFTAGSTIGNSLIYDNGSTIGIGSTAGTYYVEAKRNGTADIVANSSADNNSAVLSVFNSGGTSGNFAQLRAYGNTTASTLFGSSTNKMISLFSNGDALMTLGTISGTPLVFGTTNTERLRITSGGNVGINNNNPSYRLDVGGSIGLNYDEALYFRNVSGTGRQVLAYNGNTFLDSKDGYMSFRTDAAGTITERLRIFANGRVFVGASPTDAGYQLDINGTLRSVNGANFATTSGNVGIGTASPQAKLDVYGAFRVSSATFNIPPSGAGIEYSFRPGDSTGYVLTFSRDYNSYRNQRYFALTHRFSTSNSELDALFINANQETLINTTTDAGDYKLQVSGNIYNTGSAVLAATSGNVGIGTASPNERITIQSGAGTSAGITMRGNNLTSADELFIGQGTTGSTFVYNRGAYDMYFGTSALTRMTITSGGKVGMGVINPDGVLELLGGTLTSGTVGTYALLLGNSTRQIMSFGTDATYGYIQTWGARSLNLNSQGNNTIINSGSGEVLIGTTTDAGDYKLQVVGRGYFQGAQQDAAQTIIRMAANNASAQIKALDFQINAGSNLFVFNTAYAGTAMGFDFADAGTSRMRMTSDGELLVATTSDAGDYKLQVIGNIYNTGSITTGAPSGGSIKPWKIGEAATVSPTSPNRTIRVEIDGTVYYLHAKTTND